MVRIQTPSYLLPSPDAVTPTGWFISIEGIEQAFLNILPHWDPGTPISVRVSVQVNTARVWEECRLSDEDTLRLVMVWYSPGTGLKDRGSFVDFTEPSLIQTVFLEATIDGTLLADKVRFEIQLVLSQPGRSEFRLSPHLPGNILWREEKNVIIEGQGSRFPSELVSFADAGWMSPGSCWVLDWNPRDLNERFLGNVRLFLNLDNKLIKRAISGTSKEDKIIREIILFDIGKSMIIGAINSDDFPKSYRDYEEGSVGSSIRGLLYTYFPKESIDDLVARYKSNPSRFECELQDRFKLFQEE